MQRQHERLGKDTSTHDADIWMHLVRRLFYWTCATDSGCPLVIMVEPTQYRNSHHLVCCTMRGKRRSARLGKLLPDPLMRSGQVEVRHILIEHALKLFLVKNQQVIEAFLSDTPQEAFADRIGSWCMNGRLENLDGTRGRHPSKS